MTGIRRIALSLLPLFVVPGPAASAQTVTEWSTETRVVLAFHVNDAAVQRLLPAGWTLTRTYQIDQAADVVRSASTADRVETLRFRASGSAFAPLFDGKEALLSVTSLPYYVREVSVP
jgi:hypothetical protein